MDYKTSLDEACDRLRRAMMISGMVTESKKEDKRKVYRKGSTLLVVRGER